jgi:hypothetical protein
MVPRAILLTLCGAALVSAQDPRDLVRRSISQNQLDWTRMKDYTWLAESVEKHLDSRGKVQSTKQEKWESLIVDGTPHRRTLEKDHKPLSPQEQESEQKKLDEAARKMMAETPAEKQRRLDEAAKRRSREFAFLSEIPELFDLRLEGDTILGGRSVWLISGSPRPGAEAKSRDAKMLLKVRGRLWIDKATLQWAKVEAQTTGTISWGVFLARLNPGASLTFEQMQVSDQLWLPKRLLLSGTARLGLVKRLAQDEEIQWSNYRKFSVDSKVLADPLPPSKE